jgi:hypothetical protein
MEKALIKLAKQLISYDEASLMSLWEKYSAIVKEFEPSRRWEEAVVILGLIQNLRWKNQLFNYHWAAGRPGGEGEPAPDIRSVPRKDAAATVACAKRTKVLKFRQEAPVQTVPAGPGDD